MLCARGGDYGWRSAARLREQSFAVLRGNVRKCTKCVCVCVCVCMDTSARIVWTWEGP